MIIGVPKEIKNNENRVAITPAGVTAYKQAGHEVWVESTAGIGSGISDHAYEEAGAKVVSTPKEAWAAEMVLKVKEPQPEEYQYFYEGLILFTYLHLAAEEELTLELLDKKVTAVAYETIQLENGSLPLLTPMSEVAGRMSVQIGAHFLEKLNGGKGTLLGGVPGVKPGKVAILGGGVVGTNAAKMAIGLGADVTLLDINATRLRELDNEFHGRLGTVMSNEFNIAEAVASADLLIGAVLIPGARAPRLVSEDMVKTMMKGSVIVDVAIDQGGSIATANQISTHDQPTYEKHGVVHYAVANIPGAVSRTSTYALTNVTTQYGVLLANKGVIQAAQVNGSVAKGINTWNGKVTHPAVADALRLPYQSLEHSLDGYAVVSS
ncbi:alanine dehydrogenase [Thalassobacillus devorans]|uniref:Alanine dehydrogenase n=1 Tax=Thalassobacillus devorans TaxID=279813 RepID=A0ABQ1NSY2_9BACI|nr:alanine dehydrogenase [Thalassobacillus devorans]NIK28662.1 alanine dehydrogenase [Thalassobacillus devorans]GGC84488.1 alanine dehydrogenase [Thalassobacillus devorans]